MVEYIQRAISFVSLYLKEEIAAEGLVRRLPAYSEFLNMAALSDGGIVNYSTIARDTGVSSETIRGYFEILTDTTRPFLKAGPVWNLQLSAPRIRSAGL